MKDGLSIIIPTYNERRLAEAVESVLVQKTQRPVEVVIVDDGTTDFAAKQVLDGLAERSPDVRIFHNSRNMGVSATLNTALHHARHPFVLPLGADDMLSNDPAVLQNGNFIDRSIDTLEKNPDVVFAYSGIRVFDAVNHIWHRPQYNEKSFLTQCDVGPFIVFRKSEAEKIGGYNGKLRYGEDMDLDIALVNNRLKNGQRPEVAFFDEPYIMYRKKRDGTNLTSSVVISAREMLAHIVARSPEIYAIHFPGMEGEELLDCLMRERRKHQFHQIAGIFTHCALSPRKAVEDGTFEFLKFRAALKLEKIWHKIKGHTLSATMAPDVPAHFEENEDAVEHGIFAAVNPHTREINPP